MRESEVEAYLIQRVHEAGGEIRKVKWIGRTGAPDRRVMLPRLQCWVEVKATGKIPEPHQKREHTRMKKMGERVEVVDSLGTVDWLLWGCT